MVLKGDLGFGFQGEVVVIVVLFVPVIVLLARRRWRLDAARKAEVRRLAFLAAEEERRAEMESRMEYEAVLGSSFKVETSATEKEATSATTPPTSQCALCFSPATARCGQCKVVRYCSGKCQIVHWRQGHKDECSPPNVDKSSSQPTMSSLQEKQVEQFAFTNGDLEAEGQAPAQAGPRFPEPSTESVLSSTTDAHIQNGKHEKSKDAVRKSSSSTVDSFEREPSIFPSTFTSQVASLVDESILQDTSMDHLPSSNISPRNPVAAVATSVSHLERPSANSAVNDIPNLNQLNQNVSMSTDEVAKSLLKRDQPKMTSEEEVASLPGAKAQSGVIDASVSGIRNQNPSNISNVAKCKSQSKHDETKVSSIDKSAPSINSKVNNLESGALRSQASSVGQLSLKSRGNAVTSSRPTQMDSASASVTRSLDDDGPVTDGMTTSVKRVVKQSPIPKTSRHYNSELMLFPYDVFIKLYNYDKVELRPCGLINCGNSCYANAVLQCLTFTRPLTAYLLERFHSNKCQKREWCFTCELESLLANVKQGKSPLSTTGIVSHLNDIGSNFIHGRQEDAHEFLRYAIDAMQSVCLKEAGVKPDVQLAEETTLIQQTFGGYLQSKIKCSRCKGKSERCERMMDLTVEIHGNVSTLEEALQRFTSTEILDGDNKYECDRCKSYERAKKKLSILEAPNILTVALKRFQSESFGKLNKIVRFPEYLDLAPYMIATDDKSPVYRLYAVVVHIDDSSSFGHYVCYVKDNRGRWYKIDDIKVRSVELDKVLLEDAYMLLYARCSPHAPSVVRKAMAYDLASLKWSKDKDIRGKSDSSLRHPSVPHRRNPLYPPRMTDDHGNFQSMSLFEGRPHPLISDYSSDNSSLFSHSDEGSWSTDSTRDSTSTEELWETLSLNSPLHYDGFTNSPLTSSQNSDIVVNKQNLDLSTSRSFISDVSSSGHGVLACPDFTDRGDYYPLDCNGSTSFLYSDNNKQCRNLTEYIRALETNWTSSNEVNVGVLFRHS